MKIDLGLARLSLAALCACLLSGPLGAYIPPDLNLRRTQLVQLLPYKDVADLHAWVPQQSLLLSPQAYMQLVHQRFAATSVAWTYYAGWCYLDLLEQTRQRYVQREDDLQHAQELLDGYEIRANDALRVDLDPQSPKTLTLSEARSQPNLEQNEEFLSVFRPLPWPELGYNRQQVLQLLDACHQDMERVEQQRLKLETARVDFANQQNLWTDWLSDMAQASQKFTQAQYQQPYGDPLPLPPESP